MRITTRDNRIRAQRKQGRTYEDIGKEFAISRERVRQICLPPHLRARSAWYSISQNNRLTCYICRRPVQSRKFCESCIAANRLNQGGRDLTRGIVRGRDNNTCQVCGYKWKGTEKKRLDVHHLEGLCGKLTKKYDGPEMIHKLITVCHKCHYNLDDHAENGRYGKRTIREANRVARALNL